MTDEPNIMPAAQMISQVFKNISPVDVQNGSQLVDSWRRTVETISKNGAKLAAHSHVVDLKNGILLVEADHSGWIQLLQMHQKYILTGLRRLNKSLTIDSLAFRLAGSNAQLAGSLPIAAEKERARLQKQYDAEEELIKKAGFDKPQEERNSRAQGAEDSATAENPAQSPPLPPELQQLFDKFKSEILTNQS